MTTLLIVLGLLHIALAICLCLIVPEMISDYVFAGWELDE